MNSPWILLKFCWLDADMGNDTKLEYRLGIIVTFPTFNTEFRLKFEDVYEDCNTLGNAPCVSLVTSTQCST